MGSLAFFPHRCLGNCSYRDKNTSRRETRKKKKKRLYWAKCLLEERWRRCGRGTPWREVPGGRPATSVRRSEVRLCGGGSVNRRSPSPRRARISRRVDDFVTQEHPEIDFAGQRRTVRVEHGGAATAWRNMPPRTRERANRPPRHQQHFVDDAFHSSSSAAAAS